MRAVVTIGVSLAVLAASYSLAAASYAISYGYGADWTAYVHSPLATLNQKFTDQGGQMTQEPQP